MRSEEWFDVPGHDEDYDFDPADYTRCEDCAEYYPDGADHTCAVELSTVDYRPTKHGRADLKELSKCTF